MPQKGWNIDLARCIGCKACAVSCKAENNTSPSTSPTVMEQLIVRNGLAVAVNYRDVMVIDGGAYPKPTRTFVTVACNHCANPACMAACPVTPNAITKRASDGVVQIDQSLCIGCRYCEAVCPFGAPQFNVATKKVEKCTACVHRLDAGLEPACVTTCVGKALSWKDYNVSEGHGTVPAGHADPTLTHASLKFV